MKKTQNKEQNITVIGAGLTGLFLAHLLARRGFTVDIYDKFSEEKVLEYASNKSFAISFYEYTYNLLKKTGLWSAVEKVSVFLDGTATFVSTDPAKPPIRSAYTKDKLLCYLVARTRFIRALAGEVRKHPNVRFHFSMELKDTDPEKRTVTFLNAVTGKTVTKKTAVVFGADGVHSTVRTFIQKNRETHFTADRSPWSYKQIRFEPDDARKVGMSDNVMYAWTRKNTVLTAFPDLDGSYQGMLLLPTDGPRSFSTLNNDADINAFVKDQYPQVVMALPSIRRCIKTNPESFLTMIFTDPWYRGDFLALVGDAAHGFFPFYGQGMTAGFGDCMLIDTLIGEHGSDWTTTFRRYQEIHKPNTDMLARLSKENFAIFTRDKRADFNAIYNKLDSILHRLFPSVFTGPLYQQIFSNPDTIAADIKHREQVHRTVRYSVISAAALMIMYAVSLLDISVSKKKD